MKEKLFPRIQEMLNDPDAIDVGISMLDNRCHGRPKWYSSTPCLGWELAWQHLSADVIRAAFNAHITKMGIDSMHHLREDEDREKIQQRYPGMWFPIVTDLLQALADATGKKVYATNYHLSGWNDYYDSAETYEFVPGAVDGPKRYDSR